MALDNETRTSRRNILAAAIGGAGALAVSRLAVPGGARAADGGNAILGQPNTSESFTSLENVTPSDTTLKAIQGDGKAILAQVTGGVGVTTLASGSGTGLQAQSDTGTAVYANAGSTSSPAAWVVNSNVTPSNWPDGSHSAAVQVTCGPLGVEGDVGGIAPNTDETGVYGFANTSPGSNGVWGDSWDGTGVYGTGSSGVYGAGYNGVTGIGSNIGLYGIAGGSTAYALYTSGKIKFSGRSGRTTITSGHQYKDVTISGMTTASAVIVTLQTYKSGYSVAAAVSYAGKFRMYLNKSATSTIYFSYLVIG